MAYDTYATLANHRSASVLRQELMMLYRHVGSIRQHPAVAGAYVGDAGMSGSAARQIPAIGWGGYDILSQVADGASVPITSLTTAAYTVTVARHAKAYAATDLARVTDPRRIFDDPAGWAAEAASSLENTFLSKVAALSTGFSQSVGTSGNDFTVANFLAAKATLSKNNVPGPWIFILHGQQEEDLITSLRSETGPLAYHAPSAEIMAIRGSHYRGQYLGCDIYVSSLVPTANAGADRAGLAFGLGAIAWADGSFPVDAMEPAINAGKVKVAFDFDGLAGLKTATLSSMLGVGEAQDLGGVGIITDA